MPILPDDDHQTTRVNRKPITEALPHAKVPTLRVLLGPDLGLRIDLNRDFVVIGRRGAADVNLLDEQISRRHIGVRRLSGQGPFELSDLESTNGTMLNDAPLSAPTLLKEGDKIFIGGTVLKFVLEDEAEQEHGRVMMDWAFTDELTGLIVRRRFYEQLKYRVLDAVARREALALLMMDLDGLKRINDQHGHPVGAHIIAQTGPIIAQAIGARGQACRYGGDEFIAFLDHHDCGRALLVAEEIRHAVATHEIAKGELRLHVTISIGVAALGPAVSDAEILSQLADAALYRAKAKGRNAVSD
ncbi:MAG: diguanylate cyclase [Planctomycetota bacterium]